MIRRWTACCLAAAVGVLTLLVPGLGVPAYAAGAVITIDSSLSCNYSTGVYTITWTISTDQPTTGTVTSSDPPGAVTGPLPATGTNLTVKTSALYTDKDLQTLLVDASFGDGSITGEGSGSRALSGCAKITFTSSCSDKTVTTHIANGAVGTLVIRSTSNMGGAATPTVQVGPNQSASTQPLAADGSAVISAYNGTTKLASGKYSSSGCSSGGGGGSSGGGSSGGGSSGGSSGGGTTKPAVGNPGTATQPAASPTSSTTQDPQAAAPQTGSGSSSISKLLSSPTVALAGGAALVLGGLGLIGWMIVDSVKARKARKRRDLKNGKIRGKRPPGGMRSDDGW
jgi:hypothetical protein